VEWLAGLHPAQPDRGGLADGQAEPELLAAVTAQRLDREGWQGEDGVAGRGLERPDRQFFEPAIGTTKISPVEVVTDRAPTYPVVLEELLPAAWHRTDRYANNHIEADHGRLKARLWPMRGLKQDRSATVVIAGHSFVQNVRRGHYELAVEEPANRRVAVAFDRLALAI
jgi:hypothetical protein